ncbi:MAG: hypothetical protein EBV03_01960 [Proteobacteria bacterium]|nr:hypothetical protein [Pseudomonadota bacterium]
MRVEGVFVAEAIGRQCAHWNHTAHGVGTVIKICRDAVGGGIGHAKPGVRCLHAEFGAAVARTGAIGGARQAVVELGISLQRALDFIHLLLQRKRFCAAGILRKLAQDHTTQHREHHQDETDFDKRESGAGGGHGGHHRQHYQRHGYFEHGEGCCFTPPYVKFRKRHAPDAKL